MAKNISSTSAPPSHVTALSPLEIEIDCATEALNRAEFGMSVIESLRAILRAIRELSSKEDETIVGLARVGVNLADEYHNDFDCQREDAEHKTAVLRDELALSHAREGGAK